MVLAVVSCTPANSNQEHLPHPVARPPLIPSSDRDNAAATAASPSRRPRIKDVTSRYLSSSSISNSFSSSTTTVSSSTTRSSSSSSSTTTDSSALLNCSPSRLPHQKRSSSADRTRSVPPVATNNAAAPPAEISVSARALCTTTRSLPVSFQGESFFYQTSKTKAASAAASPAPARKPSQDRRRRTSGSKGPRTENSKPRDWPAATRAPLNLLMGSMGCSSSGKQQQPLFAAVRLLPRSMIFEEPRRVPFDGADVSTSSDSESVSSGSNSGAPESGDLVRPRMARCISVPARFWQETNNRLRRLQEPGTQLQSSAPSHRLASANKSSAYSPVATSPRSALLPFRGPARAHSHSQSKVVPIPSRAMASSAPISQPGLAPSILNFAAEMRRAKKGEDRIEEAHSLRLLHNQNLQWRFVNARANAALLEQSTSAEKDTYNAWITISEMRDSVTVKRIKLQSWKHNLKLFSILKEQMSYLVEWSHMDKEHTTSLSGAIQSLKASTLRLPVCGARADVQDVKEAVGSAVDVMQAMASSICSLLSKAEGAYSLVSELAEISAQERVMLDQARDLLSIVEALRIKECSLKGQILQMIYEARLKTL